MQNRQREDLDELNNQPANQKAKHMLMKSGQEVSSDCLHCVQLALWALDDGRLFIEDAVRETVRAMAEWRPARLSNFLLRDGSNEYAPKGWEEAEGPEDLALVILDDIETKAYATFPWYGSVSD